MSKSATLNVTPARQLASFIARYDPPVQRLIRAARSAMRRTYPTAFELVYDGFNALAIGFCSTPRASDCLVSVAAYPRGVSLYFYYGASLPDPAGRFEGSGNQGRFIRFEGPNTVAEPAVKALLKAAAIHAKTPLPTKGRGALIMKSIAPRRRSRSAARA